MVKRSKAEIIYSGIFSTSSPIPNGNAPLGVLFRLEPLPRRTGRRAAGRHGIRSAQARRSPRSTLKRGGLADRARRAYQRSYSGWRLHTTCTKPIGSGKPAVFRWFSSFFSLFSKTVICTPQMARISVLGALTRIWTAEKLRKGCVLSLYKFSVTSIIESVKVEERKVVCL